jgi:hypothetical protein
MMASEATEIAAEMVRIDVAGEGRAANAPLFRGGNSGVIF